MAEKFGRLTIVSEFVTEAAMALKVVTDNCAVSNRWSQSQCVLVGNQLLLLLRVCRSCNATKSWPVWVQRSMWLLTEAWVYAAARSWVWSVHWVDGRRSRSCNGATQGNDIISFPLSYDDFVHTVVLLLLLFLIFDLYQCICSQISRVIDKYDAHITKYTVLFL